MIKIILHIGQHKTGSSSIQLFLSRNAQILESQGYLYDTSGKGIESKNQDQYSHILIMRTMLDPRSRPFFFKYIDEQISQCEKKNLHTLILSSEELFLHYSEEHVQLLNEYLKSKAEMEVVCYLKRQDLFYESSWKQWHYKNLKFKNFIDYVQKVPPLNYYNILSRWKKHIKHLTVTPFEKKYFPEGLERHFLKSIGISNYELFNFDYIKEDDTWGANKGFTQEAMNIAYLCRDFSKNDIGDFCVQDFIQKYLSKMFEKEHFSSYDLFTYEQRVQLYKHVEISNQKVASEFLNTNALLFEAPKKTENNPNANAIQFQTVIRAMMMIGIEQDKQLVSLTKRLEKLENDTRNGFE